MKLQSKLSAVGAKGKPIAETFSLFLEHYCSTVNTLCVDCFGHQEMCRYIKMSLLRETTAVKMQ